MDLFKLPGVAETIDWTQALMQLDALVLDPKTVDNTLGVLLKYQDDIARIQGSEAAKILDQVRAEVRSEEHTSELQSLMRISYAVFCLTKTTINTKINK